MAQSGFSGYNPEAYFTQNVMPEMDQRIHHVQEQARYLISRVDEFERQLVFSHSHQEHRQSMMFASALPNFLRSCQPYFTYLESTARNPSPDRSPTFQYIRTRLLQFSEQMCSRLEQLLNMYASFHCLCLRETDPMGISHFYIGQCQVSNFRLSIFRYCLPSPFLASTSSGLYKRMRWNVERQREPERGGRRKKQEKKETGLEIQRDDTEYYFLCCEHVSVVDGNGKTVKEKRHMTDTDRVGVVMWSIGQWVQMYPNPETENIYDWVLCTFPQGQYRKLVCLGVTEPSSCFATDCLLRVLLSQPSQSKRKT